MAEMSPLRRRMIEGHDRPQSVAGDTAIRRARGGEVQSFLGRLALDRLGLEDVRAFQVHLVHQRGSQAASAEPDGLRSAVFLWCYARPLVTIPQPIPDAREPRKLPVVLSADEVVRFLEAVPSLKTRAALTTAYAAGLRASEAVGLRLADIDSGRMVIRVEHGKGGKDR